MSKENTKKSISVLTVVELCIALIAFLVIFGSFMKKEKAADYSSEKPKVILFGDSMFAYWQDENSVASNLEEILGVKVLDASFGGSCLAYLDRDGKLSLSSDAYSLAALTRAIKAGDFRYQINAEISGNGAEYFKNRLKLLESSDISGADVIVIENLINDYHSAVPAKAQYGKYDEYSYEGALRSVIKSFKEMYPTVRIVVAAPPVTWYLEDGKYISAYQKDFGGGTIDVYRDVQKSVAGEMEVGFIDLSDAYDNTKEETVLEYTCEGLHPNEAASRLLAEYMGEFLK